MKKFVLFLLLASPLLVWAQADDMYYVPKKETKVNTAKSANDFYFAEDENPVDEDCYSYETDGYAGETEFAYYTNDLYEVMDDYTYSNRIIRFQSPRRLLSSSLYWDLKYNCGINDWLVYDDGYSVYVYPTANNLYYNNPYNHWWNWNAYHYWNYPYYSYYNHWHRYDYCWHNPHWYNHHHTNVSCYPSFRNCEVPTNGSIASNRGARREQQARTTVGNTNPRRQQQARTTVGSTNPRRQQQARTTVGSINSRREQIAGATAGRANPRRQQQVRNVVTANTQRRQQQVRTTAKSSGTKGQSSSNGSVRRSENKTSGNSSSGYSRPSSTSVSRSSGSAGSGSRSGGNRNSGGGSRSSSGARSGGSRR